MSWFNVWDGLKNKTCRYLLQRYLGQFLEEKLNLDQLNVELYNGKAMIKDVALKVEAVNELFESQGWAFEVIGGHIGMLTVTVPWNALMTNDSSIEVSNLCLSLRPIKRQNDGTSMLESMWSSVSSSMQLAEECMKQEDYRDYSQECSNNAIIGLEKFAETIDNVLNRVNAKFENTILRLEYPSKDKSRGIAIICKIENLDYKNETGSTSTSSKPDVNDVDQEASERMNLFPAFAKHNVSLNGLQISTEEFQNSSRSYDETQNFLKSIYVSNHQCQFDENNSCSFEGCHSKQIPILEIKGQQKLQIKMKQSEEITGPKVFLDVEFGAIYSLITPRQIHLLLKLCAAFQEDEIQNVYQKENVFSSQATQNNNFNYQPTHMTGVLGNQGNWTEEYDDIRCQMNVMNNIYHKSNLNSESYCDSLNSSMSSSTYATGSTKMQRRMINLEACSEIVNFNIRISSLNIFLLHEDVLVESNTNKNLINEKSLYDMYRYAEQFFMSLDNTRNEAERETKFKMNEKNHILLCMSPIISEGVQQRNRQVLLTNFSFTSTKVDIFEVLEGIATPIIAFDRREAQIEGYQKQPEISIQLKSSSANDLKERSSTSIDIILEKSIFELDVSIYDRLSYLFGSSPFDLYYSNKTNVTESDDIHAKSSNTHKIEVKIFSEKLDIKLRFPIVDARPIYDVSRTPWWKQNIRTDFLLLTLHRLNLKYTSNLIDISSNEIDVFYCEENTVRKVHMLKTSLTKSSSKMSQIDYPRITINFPSLSNLNEFLKDSPEENDMEENFGMQSGKNDCNLPFSSKRECRQSDIHIKRDAAESETILLPGDTEEINKFSDCTMKSSKLQISINFPIIEVNLESKQLYEIIYNRLNTDLFMWEPNSPIFKVNTFEEKLQMDQSLFNVGLSQSVYIPSTSVQDPYENTSSDHYYHYDRKFSKQFGDGDFENSSSESEESQIDLNDNNFVSDDYSRSVYYSMHTNHKLKRPTKVKLKPSNCSVEIDIGSGFLSLFVPVRDADNHVLPGQLGKFQIKIDTMKLFLVNGYQDNNNLGYVCLRLSDFEIFHCGRIPIDSLTVFNGNREVDHFMESTFYKVPVGLTKGEALGYENREMVSLVIELKKQPDHHVKRLRMTAGIQKTTLRHNPSISSHNWLNQLIDFLDVMDYPIEGYKPFGVITEIQLHLWDCAVDYRPKKLAYRALVEFGAFTISSNIISSVNGCNLRFIVEECILSIAPFDDSSADLEQYNATYLPSTDLVPVLDIGLLDVSLRLNEKISEKCPKFDLRCSIHDVHLRTCFDSSSALAQIIAYIANDGDISTYTDDDYNSSSFNSSSLSVADLFSQDEPTVSEISKEQQDRVNLLMAEAVQESGVDNLRTSSTSGMSSPYESGIEVFYFPDESNKQKVENDAIAAETQSKNEFCDILHFESNVMLTSYFVKEDAEEALPQVKADLGDVTSKTHKDNELFKIHEEDYCIIAEEEKLFMAHCGIKDLKILGDPLRIVDNHFCLPTGKPDLLKPPDNFPTAVHRYTLCEMTFTWHMYGGKDFPSSRIKTNENIKSKPETTKMSKTYKFGVSYSKFSQGIQFANKPKEKLTWKTLGGPDRNHEVLVEMQFSKIRFSHEIYPHYMSHASRQVLLVNEIEIRDRLQTSDINKFLYYPNLRNVPNKTPQHMVVIKALHVRPNPKISSSQECSLRISLLPLRLNIDQDTLIFLADYFTNIGEMCNNEGSQMGENSNKSSNQYMQEPIMTVDELPEAMQDLQARRLVTTNLDFLMDEDKTKIENLDGTTYTSATSKDDPSPIYFREVIFSPEVSIRFDYHGRHFDLSRGPIAGLLMGLGQLQCSEIILKKIEYRRGLLGVEKLFTFLCKEWLKDIKANQLQKILSGVGPAHAFVQLFQGIYDLFWLPIEQYQKDGRLIRGLQLGAQSFSARTALAALEITSRIIQLLQFTAETAFDMVSPGPSVRRSRKLKKGKKKRPNRPKDIREGVTNAYMIVKEGINDSASNLIETAVAQHDQKGYTGAVGAVMRQIPQLVVCPAVLATQATTNILGGVKNSLVPEAKIEAREKWKDDSD